MQSFWSCVSSSESLGVRRGKGGKVNEGGKVNLKIQSPETHPGFTK